MTEQADIALTKEHDLKLCADYPDVFRDRNAPTHLTSMSWGFCCGDGWYSLIDELCSHLTWPYKQLNDRLQRRLESIESIETSVVEQELREIEAERKKIPVAFQVKEKFGSLSFYVDQATPEQQAIIQFVESFSCRVCEVCGAVGSTRNRVGWYRTRCPTHANRR